MLTPFLPISAAQLCHWGRSLLGAAFLLPSIPLMAENIAFDFERVSGDRNYHFGTTQPSGLFDANTPDGFRVISGVGYRCLGKDLSNWAVLDDEQPDTVQKSKVESGESLKQPVSASLFLRARLVSLSSAQAGSASHGGFLFGLTNSSATASGYLALVERTPGAPARLCLYQFANGKMADLVAYSDPFPFQPDDKFFIELTVSAKGSARFAIHRDDAIPGIGNALDRITFKTFDKSVPFSLLSVELFGYAPGFVGVFFRNESAADGFFVLGNFSMESGRLD